MTSLFQCGYFHLHSGGHSMWKIECDALTQEDWATLALMIVERSGPFGDVVPVPRGGIPLAAALKPYVTKGPCLVVDDVLTTGSIMEKMFEVLPREVQCLGWVVFARGPCPKWVRALFQMVPA